ncbi:MAG TPA: hypothetical protein EYQ14_16880 [Gammaproteobacteria bacterium]|nr:hypothetical protein [Gammaproteobacteria bacterium]HIL99052.1 hypothetical protein [Pseudomonadales bacterium]
MTTPPTDGKANKHLIRYLANVFAVSPSRITILKSENRSTKILRIVNPIALPGFITR